MTESLTKGAAYLTFSSFLFIVVGYFVNLWLGRSLGPGDYGIYGIIISIMNVINIIQTAGLPRALSKFTAEPRTDKDSLLKSAIILQTASSLVLMATLYLFSNIIANSLNDPSLSKYIKFSSFIFPFYGIYAMYSGYYNGLHKFGKQSLLNGVYSVSKGISVILLSYYFHLYGAIAGFIVAPLVSIFTRVKVPKIGVKVFAYKKLIHFSLPLIVFAFLSTLQQSIDLYMIKAMIGDNLEAGYYTANQNIARIPFFALSAFSAILFPGVSKSVSEKAEEVTIRMINSSIKYAVILLLPITVVFSATSSEIISLLYSNQYLPGAQSLSILSISFAFITMTSIFANILNGAGHPNKSAIISTIGVLLSIFLCLILIPAYGLTGAALATGLSGVLTMSISASLVIKRFKLKVELTKMFYILVSASVIYLLSLNTDFSGFGLLIWYSLMGILYLCILTLLNVVSQNDLAKISVVIPSGLRDRLPKWMKEK